MKHWQKWLWVFALCSGVPSMGVAGEADQQVLYRQSVLGVIGWHFKSMGAMAQGRVPFDADLFAQRSQWIATLAPEVRVGFTDATQATELPNRVKPELWYQQARFNTLADELETASVALVEAAKDAQSRDDIRKPYAKVAQTCKACHDRFRTNF